MDNQNERKYDNFRLPASCNDSISTKGGAWARPARGGQVCTALGIAIAVGAGIDGISKPTEEVIAYE